MQTTTQDALATIDASANDGLFVAVLAAGAATRFGGRKQLAHFRGGPLVTNAIRTAESVCGANSLLVAGCDWQDVHAACAPLAGFLIRNEGHTAGMGSSIAAAASSLPSSATGVVLMLADQALIGEVELLNLVVTWRQNQQKIVCCEFDALRGPPAVFPRAFFAELAELDGESGARAIIERHSEQVVPVACPQAAVDIDTPEDLRNIAAGSRSCKR